MTTESPTPSSEEYADALSTIDGQITDPQRAMLVGHCAAPEQTLTAGELARLGGYDRFETANIQYGKLGHLVAEILSYTPKPKADGTPIWTRTIAFDSEQRSRKGQLQWTLRHEVAIALRKLGWYTGAVISFATPEEVQAPKQFIEGATQKISVNSYERNLAARRACIDHYGSKCFSCKFDFVSVYGFGEGYIHVHHLVPLSQVNGEYEVNPIEDLRPLCPNCHAAIHLSPREMTPENLREIFNNR